MKQLTKFFGALCILLIAAGCFTLTSCSNDDDNDGDNESSQAGKTININGVNWPISSEDEVGAYVKGQRWGSDVNLWLAVNNKQGNTITVDHYEFVYTSNTDPQTGDVISSKSLTVSDDDQNLCSYVSGTAKVIATDNESATVEFSKLTMTGDKVTYTFNGTVKFYFDYTND